MYKDHAVSAKKQLLQGHHAPDTRRCVARMQHAPDDCVVHLLPAQTAPVNLARQKR